MGLQRFGDATNKKLLVQGYLCDKIRLLVYTSRLFKTTGTVPRHGHWDRLASEREVLVVIGAVGRKKTQNCELTYVGKKVLWLGGHHVIWKGGIGGLERTRKERQFPWRKNRRIEKRDRQTAGHVRRSCRQCYRITQRWSPTLFKL